MATDAMSASVEAEGAGDTHDGPHADPSPAAAVRVSRVVAAPLPHVWEVLVSPDGAQALLGEGAVLGGKGEPYHCADGTRGVVRSYHPLEQLRVSWHERQDAPASVVEVDLRGAGDGTALDLLQSHLVEGSDVAGLEVRWTRALAAVAARAER